MKRFHVHVAVGDIEQSIRFYATLFGAPPTVVKDDYAKWMLDDPRVNFAISARETSTVHGVDHLGIQVEAEDELAEIDARLKHAEQAVLNQTDASCCYARSDKAWSVDPAGVLWETFRTHGAITTYGTDVQSRPEISTACCNPSPDRVAEKAESACCG